MNIKHMWVAIELLIAVTTSASAKKPPYDETRKMYNQFDKTLSAVGLWGKKQQPERMLAIQNAMLLRNRLTKMMGDASQCARAAKWHVDFVSNLNSIASSAESGVKLTPFELMMAMASAEQFGNTRAACYEETEALDTAMKK